MRLRLLAAAAVVTCASGVAHAGLINPTSNVDINFDYVDPTLGAQVAPSQVFSTGTPGPFSLAAPISPTSTPPTSLYTTEPYNLTSVTGFWFTNTQVTIYNNADSVNGPGTPNPDTPPMKGDAGYPFCFSDTSATGSSCTDSYNTFDFKFTNEDIVSVSVDQSSSSDFLPATFGSHTGLQWVSKNEFTVDVTGADPAYLSTLVIDVTTGGSGSAAPEPSTWAMMLLGFAGLGFASFRRARVAPQFG